MGFEGRVTAVKNKPPLRVYIHSTGLKEVFDGRNKNAVNYFFDEIAKKASVLLKGEECMYGVAVLWGHREKGVPVADLFGYSGIEEWPGNPEVHNWVLVNGVLRRNPNSITCGESIIVLGREEECRRKTKSLEDFVFGHAELNGMNINFDTLR